MPSTADPGDLVARLAAAGVLSLDDRAAWDRLDPARRTEAMLVPFLREHLPDSPRKSEILETFEESLHPPAPAPVPPAVPPPAPRRPRRALPVAGLAVFAVAAWAFSAWRDDSRKAMQAEILRLGARAAAFEERGDMEHAFALYVTLARLDPASSSVREARDRARDTLLFARALADARAALDAGAPDMAAAHARVAEAIWPGNKAVRALLDQAQGLGRLRVTSPLPCTLLIRRGTGGEERSLACPGAAEALLPPGEYELWAIQEQTVRRRVLVSIPAHAEVRISFDRVTVAPDAEGKGLQEAVDRAVPGMVLALAAGTYREAVRLHTDQIRLEASAPGSAIVQPSSADEPALRIEGARGVEVSGLVFIGASAGVLAEAVEGLALLGCTMRGNEVGVLLLDARDVRVEGCELLDNREFGLRGEVRGGRVLNGRIAGNRGGGLLLEHSADVLVASNVLAGNRRVAIAVVRGSERAEIAENLVHACGQGIVAEAYPCRIRHNTCLESGGTGIEAEHRGDLGELRIEDNLVAHGGAEGLHVREAEPMGAALVCDHNCLAANAAPARWTTGRRSESFPTLNDWRRHGELDRHSLDADPALESAAIGGVPGRLAAASPCKGAASDGQDIGASFDGDRPRATPVEPLTVPEWGRRLLRQGD